MPTPRNTTLILIVLAVASGCDERVADVAMRAADRQAQQNTEMSRLNKSVADGTRQLIVADAKARDQSMVVHHEILAERSQLSAQWNELELQRQQIARERRSESLLVPLATLIGSPILVIVLLVFCWYVLFGLRNTNVGVESVLNELLITELTDDRPALFPRDTLRHDRLSLSQPVQDSE